VSDTGTPSGRKPSLRDRLKPVELVGMAFGAAIFAGIIVLIATRTPNLAVICAGVAFIVSLIGLAMLALYTLPAPKGTIDGPVLRPPHEPHGTPRPRDPKP
jgi:hypothetical protein